MRVRDLTFSYGRKIIFDRYTQDFGAPVTCIMGSSGTGKTTLLYLLAGLYTPSSGEILDVPADPVILFQEDRLLPWFNVRRNLLLVCEDQRKVEDMLRAVDIDGDLKIRELSGGMARRTALARALLAPGGCLLLDEPFTGMDRERMLSCAALIREKHVPTIVSTHSTEEAEALGAEIVEIRGYLNG